MKSYKINFLLFLMFIIQLGADAPSQTAACTGLLESERQRALSALHRLEIRYRNAGWYYLKAQETIHDPLWEAVQKKTSTYSEDDRAKGEVLFLRYRNQADADYKDAQTQTNRMQQEWKQLKRSLSMDIYCSGGKILTKKPLAENSKIENKISGFRNCTEIWRHELSQKLKELRVITEKYRDLQQNFTQGLEAALDELPSDHPKFQHRYRDFMADEFTVNAAQFLAAIREMRDLYEVRWPAEKCCAVCLQDKGIQHDPVLDAVKLDTQGYVGAAGKVVNKSSLKDAFERFDEQSKQEES